MNTFLQYGRTDLRIEIPSHNVTLIEPKQVPGVPDEHQACLEAFEQPYQSPPLRELIRPSDRVAIVIPDITRAFPLRRVLPWLFEYLNHVRDEQFTIINGTGTHRANTEPELRNMLGDAIYDRFAVVNHDAGDPDSMTPVGHDPDGNPVAYNTHYVEADKRLVLGFIEPHFWAGFSGGYKGVFPAIADLDSIMHYHRPAVVADPHSTWGNLVGNPTQDQVRANGSLLPVDFLINVTLNRQKAITGFFFGDVLAAHAAGCRFAKESAMFPCPGPFPLILTTNSGFPLDQNLYQTVKGLTAALHIVEEGGHIISAAACSDGFPDHGNFKRVIFENESPQSMMDSVFNAPSPFLDQWQIQQFAMVLLQARVSLYSELSREDVERAAMQYVADLQTTVQVEVQKLGKHAPIAVLPEGPMVIPYLSP